MEFREGGSIYEKGVEEKFTIPLPYSDTEGHQRRIESAISSPPRVIKVITDTPSFRTELFQSSDAPQTSELPPKVEFRETAQHAIAKGIFTADITAAEYNAAHPDLAQPFPTSMLDLPYSNGPRLITNDRFQEDVPEAVSLQLRKNWAKATKLLLPKEKVLGYFHQRFVAQDVFDSDSMNAAVNNYELPNPIIDTLPDGTSKYKDSSVSFQIDGIDRTSTNRKLFTKEEEQAGIELTHAHPEVVLTILGYQSVIHDYLDQIGEEFTVLSQRADSGVTKSDLDRYKKFTGQWDTPNFVKELVPAVALHHTLAKREHPDVPDDQLFTQQLFQDAADFIVKNGAFRNFVDVPAEVASDGNERTNHFVCPAVGAIRQQLADGSLLYRIYGIVNKNLAEGDEDVIRQTEIIKAKTAKPLATIEQIRQRTHQEKISPTITIPTEDKTFPDIAGEAISQVFKHGESATFTFDGITYNVSEEDLEKGLVLRQPQQEGDIIKETWPGDYFDKVLGSAVTEALTRQQPVYFSFNKIGYRITPDKIAKIFPRESS